MPEYLHPGVYLEERPAPVQPVQGVSTSTAAFLGITQRGPVKKPVLVTSWEQFKREFAYGLDSPFYANSYLAYAVFGFFNNGGRRAYIVRVASATAKKATTKIQSTGATPVDMIQVDAKDEGSWGNKLAVVVEEGTNPQTYKLTVKYDGSVVESFDNLKLAPSTDADYIETRINGVSMYITVTVLDGTKTPELQEWPLTTGADGEADLTAADYSSALNTLDAYEINLIAIPGTDSVLAAGGIANALLTYVGNRKDCLAVLEPKLTDDTPTEAAAYRAAIGSSDYAALYWPWIKVTDPLSKAADPTKLVPPCGHVMGIMARTDSERGVWKAPAGTQALVYGALGLAYNTTDGEQDILNPVGVNVIRSLSNVGIVVWGARTISADASLRYVNVRRLLLYIERSLYNATHFAVFEPNTEETWSRIRVTARSFLLGLTREGAFASSDPAQAFFVKCDEEVNDEIAQNEGKLYVIVGVAPAKPAEFVILRIGQKLLSQ